MKSITIHNIDDGLAAMIQSKALQEGISTDAVIKRILKDALLDIPRKIPPPKTDFDDLFGIWSKKDLEEFNQATSDFNKIDPEEWD